MKKILVELEVDDEFEQHNCNCCPFLHEYWEDYEDDGWIDSNYCQECFLGYDWENCKLKVVKND